jgi:Domain of unknown function (DUF5664)
LKNTALEVEVNKKTGPANAKAPLDLLPLRALIGPSRVIQHGGVKYAPGNYLEGSATEALALYQGAELRHQAETQTLGGQFTLDSIIAPDPESGLPHIDHQIAGLIMLRAILTKSGALAADPGPSKLVSPVAETPATNTQQELPEWMQRF